MSQPDNAPRASAPGLCAHGKRARLRMAQQSAQSSAKSQMAGRGGVHGKQRAAHVGSCSAGLAGDTRCPAPSQVLCGLSLGFRMGSSPWVEARGLLGASGTGPVCASGVMQPTRVLQALLTVHVSVVGVVGLLDPCAAALGRIRVTISISDGGVGVYPVRSKIHYSV